MFIIAIISILEPVSLELNLGWDSNFVKGFKELFISIICLNNFLYAMATNPRISSGASSSGSSSISSSEDEDYHDKPAQSNASKQGVRFPTGPSMVEDSHTKAVTAGNQGRPTQSSTLVDIVARATAQVNYDTVMGKAAVAGDVPPMKKST